MDWTAWHVSVQGGAHRDKAIPCEDASLVFTGDGWVMAAVADGHGSMKHFRSGIGAEMACQAARDTLLALGPEASPQTLAQEILARWRDMVQRHLADNPWTEEELAVQRTLLDSQAYLILTGGQSAAVAYGTTLICAAVTDTGWTALQIGDGGLALLDAGGSWSWPMPDCDWCQGNLTASLCMADAASAFRYAGGSELPVALVLYSDGVEKAFLPRSLQLGRFLHEAVSAREPFCAMKPGRSFRPCGNRTCSAAFGCSGRSRPSGNARAPSPTCAWCRSSADRRTRPPLPTSSAPGKKRCGS